MDNSEILVLCSSQPGFIRFLVPRLVSRCRLMECYTVAEAAQMAQSHQPDLTLLDLRNGDPRKTSRALTIAHNVAATQLLVVCGPNEITSAQIPEEIAYRVTLIPLDEKEDLSHVVSAVDCRLQQLRTAGVTVACGAELSRSTPASPSVPQTAPPAETESDPPSSSIPLSSRFRTQTPDLKRMLDRLEVAARHDVTILLIGETGSGKTHLARLIHEASGRQQRPFVTVACGALPGDLIESELFGHIKGAFTGAHADKDGKFIAAGDGTILLDEIDVLTPDQQVKLLRVIEQGLFEAVGSNQTLKVQARIIAASNLPLEPLVEQQRFRPDLYYRLNTLCFRIPPLRSRLPDIQPLARYFVHLHADRHGIEITHIKDDFYDCLQQYPWPGNVREMENAIRGAVIYCADGHLDSRVLPPNILHGASGPSSDPSVTTFFGGRSGKSLGNRIELTEREIIEQALQNNAYSRTRTARQLGISRVTLYNKMKKYDMMPRRGRDVAADEGGDSP
ncbi:MAG: sigma-54 dependent transcriptional regulator [Planctomycetaceae bacterium]|nr:sigma-54 dependent transcriptional regulator [Planctomycetaceae bacterium]